MEDQTQRGHADRGKRIGLERVCAVTGIDAVVLHGGKEIGRAAFVIDLKAVRQLHAALIVVPPDLAAAEFDRRIKVILHPGVLQNVAVVVAGPAVGRAVAAVVEVQRRVAGIGIGRGRRRILMQFVRPERHRKKDVHCALCAVAAGIKRNQRPGDRERAGLILQTAGDPDLIEIAHAVGVGLAVERICPDKGRFGGFVDHGKGGFEVVVRRFGAVDQRAAPHGRAADVRRDLFGRFFKINGRGKIEFDRVAVLPRSGERKPTVFVRRQPQPFPVHLDRMGIRPGGHAKMQREICGFLHGKRQAAAAFVREVAVHRHLDRRAAESDLRFVGDILIDIERRVADVVEIAAEGKQGAREVRRAAGCAVPCAARQSCVGGKIVLIKERVAVEVHAAEHRVIEIGLDLAGINAVGVELAHGAVPKHVRNACTGFAVGLVVRQVIGS